MNWLFPLFTPEEILLALLVALCGGFVKGVVGFAMPLIMVSGLTTFIAPELALAGLILPTVMTNAFQALRQGPRAAMGSIKRFRVFLLCGGVTLVISAQMVRVLPDQLMLLIIGVPVVFFALLQLTGKIFTLRQPSARIEAGVGAFAGALGGVSGIWGPPTVAYLTALNTPKHDQMRVQGVIYGLGAVALLLAHLGSGVLRSETLPFSLAMIPPALLGMWLGGKVMNRFDQTAFRRATLMVLLVAGANLIRRAVFV
ncbi:MAG: sulfite exporter TauE/SafE family protein [Sulfitobacter sp.]